MAKSPREFDDKEIPLLNAGAISGTPLKYSMRVLDEVANPSNQGRMLDADVSGTCHGWCGDTMEIYLRLNGEIITQANFMTDGGESALACGSVLTKMLSGLSLATASRIKPEDLITALGGLPASKTHCATLTINALSRAISSLPGKERENKPTPK